MLKIKDILPLTEQCAAWRKAGQSLALFSTMGSFHQGHESIMQAAKKKAQKVVLTLFFTHILDPHDNNPNFQSHDPELDMAIAAGNRIDLLFIPSPDQLFPQGYDTYVYVPALSRLLHDKHTIQHFRNVCTITLKLFNLIRPDFAFFGQDDWQQLSIVRRMVKDLHIPISIESVPTTREADGLPMNPRNQLLVPEERALAPQFCKGMDIARQLFSAGETSVEILSRHVNDYWVKNIPQGQVEYLRFLDPMTLKPKNLADKDTLIIASMLLGKTKLMDNLLLNQ